MADAARPEDLPALDARPLTARAVVNDALSWRAWRQRYRTLTRLRGGPGDVPVVAPGHDDESVTRAVADLVLDRGIGGGWLVGLLTAVAGWRGSSPRARRPRWAVWITGLPGSGKTTIASRVAEALGRRGHAVRVLDLVDVRAFITGAWSPLAEDIAHRALVYAAQRLTDQFSRKRHRIMAQIA